MEHINISSIIEHTCIYGNCSSANKIYLSLDTINTAHDHFSSHSTIASTSRMKYLPLICFLTFCSLLSAETKYEFKPLPSPACQMICSLTLMDYIENVTPNKIEEVPKWCNNYYNMGTEQEKKMVDEKCPKICDELKSALEEDSSLWKRLIKGRNERLQHCQKYNERQY
ncbi:hypothetical protein Y032_0411g965 [Ancylostoma ceylanicum]|uniref:Uncharacterized protein n=1 Tax=Ancylostoma ceylanicum TaxID=53326 RepID=A0A016X2F7_9BILA|nr:hypothetical protein Y032_0411g965 [Ancylostoma ceylanicum]